MPLVGKPLPLVERRLYADAPAAQHALVTATRTRVWVLAVSVAAGPVIGIASFALVAFAAPSIAWPLGLVALLGVPAFCCYHLGRRFGSRGLGNAAAIVAAVSSLVTALTLLVYAFSQASFG